MSGESADLSASTSERIRGFAREVVLVSVLFTLYNLGRLVSRHESTTALDHADDVWDLERWLRLPSEVALQGRVLEAGEWLVRLCNLYYAHVHFPVTFGLLAVLCWQRRERYLVMRDALVVATAGALVLHLAYPLAPPRMLDGLGFVDTGHALGQSTYSEDVTGGLSNQFAAMPSMHAGWAVIVAVVLVSALSHRSKWLVLLHPVATVLVIVVTANHYWLDAVVGGALAAVGLLFAGRRRARTG